MAVNTIEKRRAASSAGQVTSIPGVLPQAAEPLIWRWASGWSYSILAGPGAFGPLDVVSWAEPVDRVSYTEALDIVES